LEKVALAAGLLKVVCASTGAEAHPAKRNNRSSNRFIATIGVLGNKCKRIVFSSLRVQHRLKEWHIANANKQLQPTFSKRHAY
jgi:hypothetical protein